MGNYLEVVKRFASLGLLLEVVNVLLLVGNYLEVVKRFASLGRLLETATDPVVIGVAVLRVCTHHASSTSPIQSLGTYIITSGSQYF